METVQTGDFALRVLSKVALQGTVSPADVAQSLEVSKTTAQRILITLHESGALRRRPDGLYDLGPFLIKIAEGLPNLFVRRVSPIVRELSIAAGVSIVLSTREADQATVVDQATGTAQVPSIEYSRGFSRPLSVGASGLAILAFLPIEERRRVGGGLPESMLDQITRDGYAVTRGAIREGMTGIAAPIFNKELGVFGSISEVAPTDHAIDLDSAIDRIVTAAARMSAISDTLSGEKREVAVD